MSINFKLSQPGVPPEKPSLDTDGNSAAPNSNATNGEGNVETSKSI